MGDLVTPLSVSSVSGWSGDYYRADKEIISSLILLRPVGRVHSRQLTYPEVTARDSGIN